MFVAADREGKPDQFPVPPRSDGRRISPTVVSQYVRLDQCRRYLRLAIHERAGGSRFMRDYGVAPQEIPPLLTGAGAEFERKLEAAAAVIAPVRILADERRLSGRKVDNDELVAAARAVRTHEPVFLFQTRLQVPLDGWDLTGDADIVRLDRDESGLLNVIIADMKATRTSKIEHRLQVAFYREMVERLLADAAVEHRDIATAILYRGAPDPPEDDKDATRIASERQEARRIFGVEDAQLELTPEPDAYRDAVRGLVTGPGSVANEVVATRFAEIPWHLTYKCDGCLYSEFCMKWAAEHDDLSLLPHLTEHEKRGLLGAGVATTRDLAALLEPTPDAASGAPSLSTLRVAKGQEAIAGQLARTWPVGPRLEELVHRARRHRRWQGDPIEALPYIPSKGYGSLPYSDAEQNPNLVRVFIDAQHDYLTDRVYLIGSLVVCNEGGAPHPERRKSIVEMTERPPGDDEERQILLRWIAATIRAVTELAEPDEAGQAAAPIHLIFFNGFDQRVLLDALNRHAREILGATALYDFITQLAAFDSPVVTFLDREIRELKNYPMVCQSLQDVATSARPGGRVFDWNQPEPYRQLFRERLFDSLGKFDELASDDGHRPWATRRSRFNSQIPPEYAYAAWGALIDPPQDDKDPFAPYRQSTLPLLVGFQRRRLEALEHIVGDFTGNKFTNKRCFVLPDLAHFQSKANGLAEALEEFLTIERHVELAAWKSARLASPERRVLAGDTLLVQHVAAEQFPGVAEAYAENRKRAELRTTFRDAYLAANPGRTRASYTPEQKVLTDPVEIAEPFKLRIVSEGTGASLDDVLSLTTLRTGDWVTMQPRWDLDSRLPSEEQTPYTPTPKQLLYGMRQEIVEVEVAHGADGRALRAWLHTRPVPSRHSNDPPGYLFAGHNIDLLDGAIYTVDPNPSDSYGFNAARVVRGLRDGEPNELFRRVSDGGLGEVTWPESAAEGQARFMAGLRAMHAAGAGHEFEPGKEALIGNHGDAPLLLVQGPPGTGKSFTTAFAILARMQGALTSEMPFRVLVGAKTHAATDVLLENIAGAIGQLAEMRVAQPAVFAEYFDEHLLRTPLFRLQPRGETLSGVTPLFAGGKRKGTGQAKPLEVIAAERQSIVAATPGGVYAAAGDSRDGHFGNELFDLLVLDEASQLNLPESIMAALPLKREGQVIVVGDHRQMAPIVKHDWENETRRTFQEYAVYRSLFDTILACNPRLIQFERSFRLDQNMAEFLRRSIYAQDGLDYHSQRAGDLRFDGHPDQFIAAVLHPAHPLVVVVHDEASSQLRNDFERDLTAPLLAAMYAAGYRVADGFGLVVPHRAQRANLQQALRNALPGEDPDVVAAAIDTVERFQGGERDAIIVSATESDPAYLLAAGKFLYDPRRLTVVISRARDKLVVVASRSVFDFFSPDEETFASAQLWKDLLHRTCTVPLWTGERCDRHVEVWGNPPLLADTPVRWPAAQHSQ